MFVYHGAKIGVLSKFGVLTKKDINRVMGLFSKDVFDDFRKDVPEYNELDNVEKKQISTVVNREVRKMVLSKI